MKFNPKQVQSIRTATPQELFFGSKHINLIVGMFHKDDVTPMLISKINYGNIASVEVYEIIAYNTNLGKVRCEDVTFVEVEGFRFVAKIKPRKTLIERMINFINR